MQEMRVWSLVWEDPMPWATKPTCHNYWVCTYSLCFATREATSVRSLGITVKSSSPLTATRESSRAATKTQCNQKLKKIKRVVRALHSWHAQQAVEEQRASWRRVFTHYPPLRFTSSRLLAWPGPQGYAQAVFPGRFSLGLYVCIGKEAGCLISTPDAKIKTAVNWPRGGTWLDVYLGQSHFALLSLLLSLV